MARWDIFHADRLELVREQSTEDIRQAMARGELRDDDLVRPAGTSVPWARIADIPELLAPPAAPPATPPEQPAQAPPAPARPVAERLPDFEEIQPDLEQAVPEPPRHRLTELPAAPGSDVAFPIIDLPDPEPALEPPPHPLRASGHPPVQLPPAIAAPAWAWAEDDEDDEDDDEDDDLRVIEAQSDIEILAEDESPEPEPEPGPHAGRNVVPGKPPAARPAGPASHGDPQPEHLDPADARAARRDWEPSDHDLRMDQRGEGRSSHLALPVVRSHDRDGSGDPHADEEASESGFSLTRSATQKIEELDLAPMVDVAFQLVLFFMVTATTVLYKTLEIPKPSGETPSGAVAQGRSRTLDELKDDFILVEIDDRGAMKLDREPIEPVRETLVELLRRAREKTGRKTMLLSADYGTLHRNAVLAYDAAQEIGLGIAIAKPKAPQGPGPALARAFRRLPGPGPRAVL